MRGRLTVAGFLVATMTMAALVMALDVPLAATPVAATGTVADLRPDIEQFYNTGRYRQAAEALEAATQQRPEDASLHYWLGRCYFELHDFNRAATSLERAVSIDSGYSEYHDWLGKSLGRKAEQASVFSPFSGLMLARRTHHEFESAVALDAKNLEAQRDLIRYLLNAPGIAGGGEDHALDQIKALSQVDPSEGELAQAEYYVTRKKTEQAAEQYQKIVDEKPDRIGVYFEIAEYDRDRGNGELMGRVVEAGAKLAPFDPRLQYYRGVAWILQKKNYDSAEKDLRTYLDTVPDSSESPAHSSAREWLGMLYEAEGKLDRAAEQYQTALTLDPRSKAAHDGLKRLHK